MNRLQLDALLEETIVEVVTLSKKDRDSLIDALLEMLSSEGIVEIDEDEDDEDDDG